MPHSILNVVESIKEVLLVGFLLISIILQCENCLSKPFAPESGVFTFKLNSSTIKRVFRLEDLTLQLQMPHPLGTDRVKCRWVAFFGGGGGGGKGC